MLDVDNVIPFLIHRGLVSEEDIVAGAISIEAIPRRNANIRVFTSPTSGLFLKQPGALAESSQEETLRDEASFYRQHASPEGTLAESVPCLVLYEPALPVLVLELLTAHQTLGAYYRSFVSPQFPIHILRELGGRLGMIHRTLAPYKASHRFYESKPGLVLPYVSQAHKPSPTSLTTLSPAGLSVLQVLQSSAAIAAGLDGIGPLWEANTMIHGDIRGDNVLVRAENGASVDIRIIDWELVQVGDALWDVSGLLQDLVLYWVGRLPLGGEPDVTEIVAKCPLPWSVMQAAGRALWQGYLAVVERGGTWEQGAAIKLAHFAAARIVHAVLEMTAERAHLSPVAVVLLQISENVFADPARAAREFFAITS
jgi:hypothetical protein